jgi:hypothetical protein
MDLPEDTPQPEEPTPATVSYPEAVVPEGFTPLENLPELSRARRRRARRALVPPGTDERAVLLERLARRAFPSFEFFLFAFLSGVILGAAYLLNAPALLLLGVLLSPLLAPWLGITLAAATGSWRFFFLTLLGLVVAFGLVFLTGALAGMAGQLFKDPPLYYASVHAQLWWPDLAVVALGAILLAVSFVRSEQKPILASLMLAYGFFLPLSAAGIGLGLGRPVFSVPLFPNGLLVFLVHLSLAALAGMLVLGILRFKPQRSGGYVLSILTVLISLAGLITLTGAVPLVREAITSTRRTLPTPTLLSLPTQKPTVVPTRPSIDTPVPSPTPFPTATLEPTPFAAIIASPAGGGANMRSEPGSGYVMQVLINGITIQVLPQTATVGSENWTLVRAPNGDQGWVLQSILSIPTVTPPPNPTTAPTP